MGRHPGRDGALSSAALAGHRVSEALSGLIQARDPLGLILGDVLGADRDPQPIALAEWGRTGLRFQVKSKGLWLSPGSVSSSGCLHATRCSQNIGDMIVQHAQLCVCRVLCATHTLR